MSRFLGPELLEPTHQLADFDSGNPILDGWLRRRAVRNQQQGSSRTWVACESLQVIAYYASSTAVLARIDAPGRMSRNQPDPMPAMLLGRLAVDRRYQGRGIATALLKHFLQKSMEVADLTGLRVVLVHAADEQAASFYRRFGFAPSPTDALTMLMLIRDIRQNLDLMS